MPFLCPETTSCLRYLPLFPPHSLFFSFFVLPSIQETVSAIRVKLKSRSKRVVRYALTMIEAVVKNCPHRVLKHVASEKFMKQMMVVARDNQDGADRDSLETEDQVLDLVQAWGEAFLPQSVSVPLSLLIF